MCNSKNIPSGQVNKGVRWGWITIIYHKYGGKYWLSKHEAISFSKAISVTACFIKKEKQMKIETYKNMNY